MNPDSTSAAPALERCPGWSQREKTSTGKKSPLYMSQQVAVLWYCCLAFRFSTAATKKKNSKNKQTNKTKNDVDPAFLERSYVGLNAPLWREGLVCAEMDCYPASMSAVCCAVNVKPRGSDTHRPFNPPSLRPLPYLTLQFQAALAYLINRASPPWGPRAPNETYNNVTSNVKGRVISTCVFVHWRRAWCWGLKCVV